jgi:hypothetical protein
VSADLLIQAEITGRPAAFGPCRRKGAGYRRTRILFLPNRPWFPPPLGPARAAPMDQLTDLLASASVKLDDDVLDRIDQIVPPGVT